MPFPQCHHLFFPPLDLGMGEVESVQQQEAATFHWGGRSLLGDGTARAALLEKKLPCVNCSKQQAVLRLCRTTAL